ncbi:hypothetical protein [Corynebacterium heidelbergense]|uniref:Lipoprotein n=1 Tax=Corynebacterium heidelbergense TaxID=2055947 RepID=A0A364VD72_9CORY|nr:hypothetical protein [Corynebacterium heidelbergense]RAV34587.1 hypothetical protein CWC39_02345 [Corynebacterium heidelbergense]WCZ36645.1 hypothetical protein CHEID_05515 [Corynebacterium heidelbergense]
MKFRSITAVGLALATAAALAACSPPHQKDGGPHVDTATTGATAPSVETQETPAGQMSGTAPSSTGAMGWTMNEPTTAANGSSGTMGTPTSAAGATATAR